MPRQRVRIRQAADGSQWISTSAQDAYGITDNVFGRQVRTQADRTRRYFGAQIVPETIESAIRHAEWGYMRELTDLIKETINFDAHLASIIPKRFRALASVEAKVVEATGPGVDPAKAKKYAEFVRWQITRIPNFRQQIMRLDWGHCLGRSALEKVWRETRGGEYKYEIAELNWLHPRRLAFGPERELRVRDDAWGGGMFEATGLDIENIPHKFITYKPQLFDEYAEREGFGARCLYFALFKRFSWRDRMTLLEIFGKPWRILEIDATPAGVNTFNSPDDLDDLQDRADELGANCSAAFPPGVKLRQPAVDPKSHEGHKSVSDDCDDQNSKLVLGNTRTTDAKSDGLGGQQSLVHQDGETLVIAADGWGIGDCLTEHVSRDSIVLNYGEQEAINAPTIELRYESAPDQTVEIDRTTKVFSMGLPLKVEEVYRRCGFEQPQSGDAVLTQQVQGSGVPGVTPTATTSPSVVPSQEQPPEGTDGAAPALPLAQATLRSLRLSRLSSDYFSKL